MLVAVDGQAIARTEPSSCGTPLTATFIFLSSERFIEKGHMQAQRLDNLLGKIVRIDRTAVSPRTTHSSVTPAHGRRSGHTVIGIHKRALHPVTGELWEIEHGTRGGDELNIARAGKNYGWPTIAYHCVDICFWFHNTDLMYTHTGGARPRRLAEKMPTPLVQFMKTGDRNGAGLTPWPKPTRAWCAGRSHRHASDIRR
jgi:hypothetical protein